MKLNSSKIICLSIIFILLIIMVMRISCSKFSDTSIETIENKEEFGNEEDIGNKEEFGNKKKENINSPTFLFGINHNSALENLKENKEIKDRINCFTAPLWWYPKDSYDPEKFKSKYYPDYFDKNLNYWGNAQERFWDFKSVLNTFTVI